MKTRDFILLAVLTFLTVILWSVFEIIHTAQKSTISPIVSSQMKPISPSFDLKLLKELKLRQN